jgi:glycosyltransferase involved in cell wall biosynthesis
MRILALIEQRGHVSSRYRLEAFAPALRARGASLHLAPVARNIPERLRLLRSARDFDLVILQRRLLPLWQLALLRWSARRLVFDFDDAMHLRDSFHRRGFGSLGRTLRFQATVAAADLCLPANEALAEHVRQASRRAPLEIVPTVVDLDAYRPAPHDAAEAIRLVWIGAKSTTGYIAQAAPAIAHARRATPGLILRIVSDAFPELPGVEIEPRPWTEAGEAAALAESDIGVAWMPDDPWTRGKSALKVLQYMAAGLPVVANPVRAHEELIRPDETGHLAATSEDWSRAIARLAADASLRRRIGAAARRRVAEDRSVQAWQPRFCDLLDDVHRRDARPARAA